MTTERITPAPNCRYCGGSGRVKQRHLPGYTEELVCDCVLDQMQDDDAELIIEDAFDGAADAAYDDWRDSR